MLYHGLRIDQRMGRTGLKNGWHQGDSNLSKRDFFFSFLKFFQFYYNSIIVLYAFISIKLDYDIIISFSESFNGSRLCSYNTTQAVTSQLTAKTW